MPLTKKGYKIRKAMREKYGKEEGDKVFYASINAGKVTGVEEKKRKHPRKPKQRIRKVRS